MMQCSNIYNLKQLRQNKLSWELLVYQQAVWAFCNGIIQPLEGDNNAADGPISLWLPLSHTLSVTGGVFPLVSQKKHMSAPQEVWSVWRAACLSPHCFCVLRVYSFYSLFSAPLSPWTVLLTTWTQLVSWKSGNTLMQMVRTVGYIFMFMNISKAGVRALYYPIFG